MIARGAPDLEGARIFSNLLRDIDTYDTEIGSRPLERISTVPINRGLHVSLGVSIGCRCPREGKLPCMRDS